MENHIKFLELAEAEYQFLVSTTAESSQTFDESIALLEWLENNKSQLPISYLVDKQKVDPNNTEFSTFSFFNKNSPKSRQFYKKTIRVTDKNDIKKQALRATWIALVSEKAEYLELPSYEEIQDVSFLAEIARMSADIENISEIFNILKQRGIGLIIEQYIAGSEVDAVVMLNKKDNPIIGMSLRYDRLDNFWFSLLHELAHIILHISEPNDLIIDDLNPENQKHTDEIENEANHIARQAIIPSKIWNRSELKKFATKKGIYSLAEQLQIHPALVAGRVQWESGQYSLHRAIIDQYSIRTLLEDKLHEIL